MTKVCLVGYYGGFNDGDDWLEDALTILFAKHQVNNPSVFSKKAWWPSLWTLLSSDVVVVGGGSLFQDKTSIRNSLYYAGLSLLASFSGKRVWALGQGIGPIKHPAVLWLVKHVFRFYEYIVLRDAKSLDYLLPKDQTRAHVLTDLVIAATPYASRFSADAPVGLCLSKPMDANLLSEMMEGGFSDVMGIVSLQEQDLPPLSKLGVSESVRLEMLRKTPINFSLIVSARYHVCVWAALNGVPFVALGDDPKLQDIADLFGQPHWVGDAALPLPDIEGMQARLSEKLPEAQLQASRYDSLIHDWLR